MCVNVVRIIENYYKNFVLFFFAKENIINFSFLTCNSVLTVRFACSYFFKWEGFCVLRLKSLFRKKENGERNRKIDEIL